MTREEIRYLRDSQVITPVSYAKKVAPLPEDKTAAASGELSTEGRRIEADNLVIRRVFRAVEEEKPLPFPTFIKVEEKKEEKKVYDLQDAIRQVKVGFH